MFFTSLLLAIIVSLPHVELSTCSPEPLPKFEERTDGVWEEYLNETLKQCFVEFGDELLGTKVTVVPGQFAGIRPSPPDEAWEQEIFVGREFLNVVTEPEEVVFVLGHEVGHALIFRNPWSFGREEGELVADLFATRVISNGAYHGARVLNWFYTQSEMAQGAQYVQEREWLRERRNALIAQCELQMLLVNKKYMLN